MRNRDIERQIRDAAELAAERARHYTDGAVDGTQSLLERGRRRINERFGRNGQRYGRQLTRAAEDFADEANYRYRRLRRQISRNPAATAAIVVGTIGAFLLLRRAFRDPDDAE